MQYVVVFLFDSVEPFRNYGFKVDKHLLPMNRDGDTLLEVVLNNIVKCGGDEKGRFIFFYHDEPLQIEAERVCQKMGYDFAFAETDQGLNDGEYLVDVDQPLMLCTADVILSTRGVYVYETARDFLIEDKEKLKVCTGRDIYLPEDYIEYWNQICPVTIMRWKGDYMMIPGVYLRRFRLDDEIDCGKSSCVCKLSTGEIYAGGIVEFDDYDEAIIIEDLDVNLDIVEGGKWHRDDFVRGWFIGAFSPAIVHTNNYEVGFLYHQKDEKWDCHYHKVAYEVNYLYQGEMMMNGVKLRAGDVFVMKPGQLSVPVFITDCKIVCVKTPSVKGDKYCL